MKKIISIILLMVILLLNVGTVKADDEGTEAATAVVTLNAPATVPVGTTTVTATINLGALTNIDAGRVVGYTATLAYDATLVEQVTMTGENGWTATCTNGAIVASIDNVEANKEIAKITFTLKEGLQAGQELTIALNNFRISNDVNLDQTFNLSKTVTLTAVEQPKENTTQNETTNEVRDLNAIANTTNKITTNETNQNALKVTSLPKTGIKNMLILAVIFIAIAAIGFKIREKSIKLK